MKETTKAILEVLDTGASGEIHGLPLASDLYPADAQEQAIKAFSHLCRIEVASGPDVHLLNLSVKNEHRSDAARIVGEFLNHLLTLSIRDRLWLDH